MIWKKWYISIASGGDGKRDVSNAVEKLRLIEEGQSGPVIDSQKEVAAAIVESDAETTNNL